MNRTAPQLVLRAVQALTLCVVAVLSCSDADRRLPAETRATASPAAPIQEQGAAAIDLGAIIRQVRLAFRQEPGGPGWTAQHRTWTALATEDKLVVTPRLRDGSSVREGPPITFESATIGRGTHQTQPPHLGGSVDSDGHLVLSRGMATELLANTEQGIHQSFRFFAPPAGEGDLEVHVRVTGAPWAAQTPEGHSFFDPSSHLGLRYGAATWVDAHGSRSPLVVRHLGGGELAIVVPDATLRSSAFPAEIDPIVSSIIDVNQPVMGDAGGLEQLAALAFDGTNYLVVWVDSRAIDGRYCAIYGARVTPAGTVLDPAGFEIFTTYASSTPGIAFDGTNYMVTIVDPNGKILVNRVTQGGVVLDGPGGKTVATVSAYVDDSAIAFGGTNYLLTWSDYIPGKIIGLLVDQTGKAVGSTFVISSASGQYPRVGFNGVNFFVAWQDKRSFSFDIYGSRVSPTGTVLDPAGIAIFNAGGDQTNPVVTFDGFNDVVVWQDGSNIVGARISLAGAVLDPTGIAISTVQSSVYNARPFAAYDGSRVLVTWARTIGGDTGVMAARVTSSGTVLDPSGIVVSNPTGSQDKPTVTCSGLGCLVAWQDSRDGNTDIYAARVQNSTLLDPNGIHLSMAASEQGKPAMALANGTYFVVWEDRWSGPDWNIYGARVDLTGKVLDPAGIVISSAAADQLTPRVAASNGQFLVAWTDNRYFSSYWNVFGTRVSFAGSVLDPSGIQLTTSNSNDEPAVASDGTNFLVAWHEANGPGVNNRVQAVRVSPAGSALDGAPLQLTPTGGGSDPAIAFGGGQYLVVFDGSGIRGERITTAGAILDPAPGIAIGMSDYPSVGYDGSHFVVAARYCWYPGPPDNLCEIHARRVDGAGAVIDTSDVKLSTGTTIGYTSAWYRMGPEVTFDGVDTLVVWSDFQADKVFGAWLSPLGQVFGSGALLSTTPAVIHSPVVVGQGDGNHSLVAYCFGDQTPGTQAFRVKANVVTFKILGQPCTLTEECKSGYCVDGVCCDTACGGLANDCRACSVAAGALADGTCAGLTGVSCSDGDLCTQTDTCQSGTCVGANPIACATPDECHLSGTCNPATGVCSNPAKADGTACNDGDGCTQSDTCKGGSCTGGTPVVCAALDQCHDPGTCNPATGACSTPAKSDGAACDDGDACTQSDSCSGGVCTAGSPITCQAMDECHEVGVCDSASGQCSSPVKTDGTPCAGGACQGGDCIAQDGGTGGTAGAGGTGGSAGQGGSGGTGGTAGQGGTGGAGGTGGTAGQGGTGGTGGSAGTGGAGGAAGQGGTGGTGGTGGQAGMGGSGGTSAGGTGGGTTDSGVGGALPGDGAAGGTGDDAAVVPAAPGAGDSGGCGCRTGGSRPGQSAWLGVGLLAMVALRRRKRRDG